MLEKGRILQLDSDNGGVLPPHTHRRGRRDGDAGGLPLCGRQQRVLPHFRQGGDFRGFTRQLLNRGRCLHTDTHTHTHTHTHISCCDAAGRRGRRDLVAVGDELVGAYDHRQPGGGAEGRRDALAEEHRARAAGAGAVLGRVGVVGVAVHGRGLLGLRVRPHHLVKCKWSNSR